jgi:S1-C subfamily serine protease
MAHELRTRRRFLGALGTALTAGIAGCSDTSEPGESTASDTPTARATQRPASTAAVDAGSSDDSVYRQVYEQSIDSVVLIRTRSDGGGGQGSGFVYSDGHVVTNDHVVTGASAVEVRFTRGEWRAASIVGTDPSSDLAVVRVQDPPAYPTPLPLTDAHPTVGTEVVAIGSPYGLVGSLTSGLISGVNRSIPAPNGYTIPDAIQTSAPVNPGNSGGPLVDLDGRVEGVVSSAGGENLAFAVSAALLKRVVSSLIEHGEYEHAYMGVQLATVRPSVADQVGLDRTRGVLVTGVGRNGPSAGVLRRGDVILQVENRRVADRHQLASYLALDASPGDSLDLALVRDGERRTVDLTLGAQPDRPGAGP